MGVWESSGTPPLLREASRGSLGTSLSRWDPRISYGLHGAKLWPNKNNMNVVLDLGANIECNEKNLVDFACMGSALFKSLFNNPKPKIALLNVGLEEYKGNV